MKTFIHLINPVRVANAASDLFAAQPVTFATMADARAFSLATGRVDVHLCAAGFPEDHTAFPPRFHVLPDLARSVLDTARFAALRRLPLLADLIARALAAADRLGADWIIYTNVDIALQPDFYEAVAALLDRGYDAFTINRRTIQRDWTRGAADLPLMRAQIGEPHPGRDCFVFRREAARRFDLGLACIGAQYVGKVLAANMLCQADAYADFADLHLTFHLGDDRRWLSAAHREYGDHNRRELAAVLRRLMASGHAPAHPAWAEMAAGFADGAD